MRQFHSAISGALVAVALTQLIAANAAEVDAARLHAAPSNNADWLSHGRTYDEQRFSPLARINQTNVGELKLAWFYDFDTTRGQEATPLVIDGAMYVTSAWSKVFALDARTGRELWRFDPKVAGPKAIDACCDVVNRGVAAWGNRVFVGALDGRLIALDRATGAQAWSVQTTDPTKRYTITGAPRVIGGKVIIGNGGGEMGVRGYVSAYDANDGKLLWRFYTVPGNPKDGFDSAVLEKAAKTWHGEWWKYGGGGTVWDSMAYDPQLDLLYIGVGNGSPWNHRIRSNGAGDNLFLSSIVALKPATGEYVWHFQTTPAESWDFTATQHIILADLTIDGRARQVLMQAPKNGFFFVIDRATGEFIHAKNYVNVTWTTGLDPKTGRPGVVPEARYVREPAMVAPGPLGAHNWYPMTFSPQTQLAYIPALETSNYYQHDDAFQFLERTWNTGVVVSRDPANAKSVADAAKSKGGAMLLAWDPVAQREVWRVNYQRAGNGGLLSTAGSLVFQGSVDGMFNAYAADTGVRLWSQDVQNAILGGPVTFELDDEQYVVALAGIGGVALAGSSVGSQSRSEFGRVVAFKLGGKAALPALIATTSRRPPDVRRANAEGDIEVGHRNYTRVCMACHGENASSNTAIPDLRYSNAIVEREAFKAIVIDGVRADKGMVGFGSALSPAEVEEIRAYLVSLAIAL
ncbi:PQQ-dependent dehydrogenase, methanol/ethanol family [Steroidobacter sp.]|uniref:PQQ-dependent dehydrogenase, methanol/ethanol family n=1 Tax=Steroidobacter sp. TaxID=1978227 RepID=UPI001A416DCD|nr:PQQ-dependent dehydrogenase, methanol/ethanol family [Steroidobacter sp.]MBL8270600.1 PQQ-dependent dehydrogenase, methanol/ethanol family [Steroidobacter sp.]